MKLTMHDKNERDTITKNVEAWDGKVKVSNRRTAVRTPHPKDKVFRTKIVFEIADIEYDPKKEELQNVLDLVQSEQASGAITYVNGKLWSPADLELRIKLTQVQDKVAVEKEELQLA